MCKDYKFKDNGQSARQPIRDLRKMGLRKRVRRHQTDSLE